MGIKHVFQKLEQKVTLISGTDYTPGPFSLEQLLTGAASLFRTGAQLRLAMAGAGLIRRHRLDCPVISIGNIMAGGTGKTPMAVYLARLLARMGKTPVVLSRGYRGRLDAAAAVAGDGKRVFLDADRAGDEPFMMAQLLAFPVVVGKDRFRAGLLAQEQLSPDIMILDDGFQHIRLERDLDLLLLDYTRPFGNNRVLPAGRLRETPETAAKRAHAVILTRCPDSRPKGIPHPAAGRFPGLPLFYTRHQPYLAAWIDKKEVDKKGISKGGTNKNGIKRDEGSRDENKVPQGKPKGLSDLRDRRILLFSGIADNSGFAGTVAGRGGIIADHLEFSDHYRYKGADLLRILARAEKAGADLIMTTEKDWAKAAGTIKAERIHMPCDLAVAGIGIEFEDEKGFAAFIRDRMTL